ncbi:MAG: ABC transporter ATP-binding protein, partial [Dehalococcoidia bacterium]|nr:ABC transporter ATP-binding protein [Dehalococcoidia bacterium]
EGRTVFLSSHLMSEMEETAEHIVVIGRGQLIADANIEDFTRNSTSSHVRVVSPRSSDLVPLLRQAGAAVVEAQEALTVTGVESGWIGRIAAEHGIELHELTPRRASLEAAFMELTGDSVEYRATAASTLETMEVR